MKAFKFAVSALCSQPVEVCRVIPGRRTAGGNGLGDLPLQRVLQGPHQCHKPHRTDVPVYAEGADTAHLLHFAHYTACPLYITEITPGSKAAGNMPLHCNVM